MRGRYRVLTLAWCALALTAALSLPAARAQTEGTDYKVLTPSQPTPTSDGAFMSDLERRLREDADS